ncbi:hypothetical protein [Draconibacterium halophilum]|uniref:ABC-2 family transporter protein n=1 Tax=Draconibacterium halophilum TaxID=2706887 RepID=A0A6C0RCW3_9BACT|nr:hypothetical protein [Draconibacterium halophilum]QIA07949.1 hypothetical protein G0Q07_09500 [Draconibacterium halophilum]
MWKSIIYKEWLKIRWVTTIYAALGVLVVGNIFLKVQHDFVFNETANYWYSILFQGHQFFAYSLFKFVPVAGGLAIALAQYFPETVNKRIKLTFHLPVNENKVLLIMILFGAFCLFAIGTVIVLLFAALSLAYFPAEIIQASLISVAPWFLCGFVVYFFTALIVLEPVWKYRFLYLLVAATFVPIYLQTATTGAYYPALPLLIVFAVLLSFVLLFSGYRFRKGEM